MAAVESAYVQNMTQLIASNASHLGDRSILKLLSSSVTGEHWAILRWHQIGMSELHSVSPPSFSQQGNSGSAL